MNAAARNEKNGQDGRRLAATLVGAFPDGIYFVPLQPLDSPEFIISTIADALDGHLCRCTGYIKYHEAVRDVIIADPARYLRGS